MLVMEHKTVQQLVVVEGDGNDEMNIEDVGTNTPTTTNNRKRKILFRNYIPSDPKLLQDHNISNDTMNKQKRGTDDDDTNYVNGVFDTDTFNNNNNNNTSNVIQQQKQKEQSVLQLALQKARYEIANSNITSNNSRPIQSSTKAKETQNKSTSKTMDLKRKIQSKLQILEKRTQRAIVTLLREKLEREAAVETTPTGSTTTNSNNNNIETID